MKIVEISNTFNRPQKIVNPLKEKKEVFTQKCRDISHKKISEISTKEIPWFAAAIGLILPIPFACIAGFLIGKGVEITINALRKKK